MEPNNSALMTHSESLCDGAKTHWQNSWRLSCHTRLLKMFLNKWNILPAAQGSPQEWSRGRMRTIAVRLRGRDDTWFDETDEMSWFALETCEFNSHGCRGVSWIVTFNNRSIWRVLFFFFSIEAALCCLCEYHSSMWMMMDIKICLLPITRTAGWDKTAELRHQMSLHLRDVYL